MALEFARHIIPEVHRPLTPLRSLTTWQLHSATDRGT